jgi:hypothetical protein
VRRGEGRYEGKSEMDIFRMRSLGENADDVPAWTGRQGQLSGRGCELCSGSRFGPLAGAHSGPSLKIDDSHEMVRKQGEQT